VPIAVWATLAFFLAVLVAGTIWVAVSGLQAWRRTRRILPRLLARVDELQAKTTVLERRAAELSGDSETLQLNAAQLSASLVRLRILLSALQEVRLRVAVVRVFLPSR
jgi:hypothetical protein